MLLEIDRLSVAFDTADGTVRAVDDVSYAVDAGETVAVVGESGSGKSVGALALMGLLASPPASVSGAIRFEGRDLAGLDDEALRQVRGRRIGMVFQEPMTSLNPLLTIGRQLTEGMRLHLGLGRREARAKAVELLTLVGISEPESRLAQYPHQFSGGMRQRVMIAIALACDPALILADEPTTALDVTIQAQILQLMKGLTERLGVAMILITHDLGIVARYATRVNVMYAGRIVESAPTRELYARPRHPYTLGLLASVPRLDAPADASVDAPGNGTRRRGGTGRGGRLVPIEGQPPDLSRLPDGCAYRARCPHAVAECARVRPPLVAVGEDHLSACLRADELPPPGVPPASDVASGDDRAGDASTGDAPVGGGAPMEGASP